MNPLWTLAPLGALAGAAGMWAFLRIANTEALGKAAGRIQAHLLEAWLYVDEPAQMWKTWRGLLAANGRFLWRLLAPLAVISIPMTPLLFLLDAQYGHAPLERGKPALVTARLAGQSAAAAPVLMAPEGVAVEAAVRVPGEREVSWRVRPERAMEGRLRVAVEGAAVERIDVAYPAAEVGPPGWETHWSVWFFGFSVIGALALTRRPS